MLMTTLNKKELAESETDRQSHPSRIEFGAYDFAALDSVTDDGSKVSLAKTLLGFGIKNLHLNARSRFSAISESCSTSYGSVSAQLSVHFALIATWSSKILLCDNNSLC
jgi:hypothetical protein